jgi:multidrug efflux system membrane fusion protein
MKNVQQFSTLLKPLAASLALAGLVAVSLAGCDSANSKVPTRRRRRPPISAAAVVERQITETQEFSGRLEAIERVEIRSRVGGFITAVNFKPGSEVKKGDVLFVIDPRPFQAEVSRAEARLHRPAPRRNWPSWNCRALKSCWPKKPSPSANSMKRRRA